MDVADGEDGERLLRNERALPQPRARQEWGSQTRAAIARHKSYPASLKAAAQAAGIALPKGRVVLAFAMDRDGRLVSLEVKQGSGIPEFDAAALSMVRNAAPLPAPPPEVVGDIVKLELPISFSGNE